MSYWDFTLAYTLLPFIIILWYLYNMNILCHAHYRPAMCHPNFIIVMPFPMFLTPTTLSWKSLLHTKMLPYTCTAYGNMHFLEMARGLIVDRPLFRRSSSRPAVFFMPRHDDAQAACLRQLYLPHRPRPKEAALILIGSRALRWL